MLVDCWRPAECISGACGRAAAGAAVVRHASISWPGVSEGVRRWLRRSGGRQARLWGPCAAASECWRWSCQRASWFRAGSGCDIIRCGCEGQAAVMSRYTCLPARHGAPVACWPGQPASWGRGLRPGQGVPTTRGAIHVVWCKRPLPMLETCMHSMHSHCMHSHCWLARPLPQARAENEEKRAV